MEKILYNAMFSKIQKEIKEHRNEIENMKKIDEKYCKRKIDIEKFLNIIEFYKLKNVKKNKKEKIVFCNGNPYVVLNLELIAIINNFDMKINIDETCIGVNKYILKIINVILDKNNIDIKIEFFDKLENVENAIFIDRINDYNIYKNRKKNIKFIPNEMIEVFFNCDEYEELLKNIYDYASEINIGLDIFDDDENIENMFKYGKAKKKLILTKSKEIIEKYKAENVYINKNPFIDNEVIFNDEMIKKIAE